MASKASAHGFGERTDLPLPLWLWVLGAGATILVTFVLVALFLPGGRDVQTGGRTASDMSRTQPPAIRATLRATAVFLFLLTIAAGLYGTADPFRNLAPTMVWIVWWVGFAFFCALVGDAWAALNPLATMFEWAEVVFRRGTGKVLSLEIPYPPALGSWPAVGALLVFAVGELIWVDKDDPHRLASALVAYSLWTWGGMWLFGRGEWLRRGEAFSVAFGIYGRFAPLDLRDGRLAWRAPSFGLLDAQDMDFSRMLFVLTMLATVTFDGLLDTPAWTLFVAATTGAPALAPFFRAVGSLGFEDAQVVDTLALASLPWAFLAVYLGCCQAIVLVVRPVRESARDVAIAFVLTLVPIAIAYHLAHYLSLLLGTGQFIIPLASDPLGRGWNLFGTAGYQVELGWFGAKLIWYSAVIAIVAGHVASVYLAHRVALERYANGRTALASQLPMVALMMLYTMTSLWILAQPIVG